MSDNWFLYINKESLQVCRVSPLLEEDETSHLITVDKEIGLQFINSPHLIYDYVVYYDGNKAHFIKKDKSTAVIVPFFYSPLIIDQEVENADIQLTVNGDQLFVAIRPEIKAYAMTMYANIDRQKQLVEFYVSAKNDPNRLKEILYVNMMDLITKGFVSFTLKHDPKRISIFTRKIFDTYSLKS